MRLSPGDFPRISTGNPSTLRILHVMRTPVGGLFRHVRDLARAQVARGHHVGVVCDATTSDGLTDKRLAELEPMLRLGLHRIAMRRDPSPSDGVVRNKVADLAIALRADVLHGHGAKGGAYARLAKSRIARRSGRPVAFYTPHGGTLHYKPSHPIGWIFTRIEAWLASVTDGLIFESAYAGRLYEERIKVETIPRLVIPNGLLPAEFEPVTAAPDAAEFLYLGELRDIKGVDVLLDAFARVNADHPIRLNLFGDGPDRGKLEARARELAIADRIAFRGATPIRSALASGRAMVVPSRAESLPYVVLETAAARVPLIATSVGGIPEIVAGTDTALVPPDNADALARAMRAVLDDPAAATARADRLALAMGDRFTVAAMTDAVLAFYARALAER